MATEDNGRWLIVGLGNHGARYCGNRHNVGFMVVNALIDRSDGLSWRSSTRFSGELAVGQLSGRSVVALKPQTYMNLSGRSAGPLAHFYRIPAERVIAIHDDIDLDPGRVKVKLGGGAGGHKGLLSLIEHLGSADFVRVRLGVGRPAVGDVSDYVLSDFPADDDEVVEEMIARSTKAVRTVITRGAKEAMNRYNRPPKRPRPKVTDEETNEKPDEPRES